MDQYPNKTPEQLNLYLQQSDRASSLEEDDAIQDKLLELARNDPESFVTAVQEVPIDGSGWLQEIYEALAMDAAAWADFYISEVDRLIEAARTSSNPALSLSPLDMYLILTFDRDLKGLQRALLEKFTEHADQESGIVRRKCIVLMGDFATREDYKSLNRLESAARSDPDWRVRYLAFKALDEIQPKQTQTANLPLWIRLRARLPYSGLDL